MLCIKVFLLQQKSKEKEDENHFLIIMLDLLLTVCRANEKR